MAKNEDIAREIEMENQRKEMAKYKPPKVNMTPVEAAKYVWVVGTVVLDVATAYYIWQTTLLFYGILWILVGAGGLIYSEWQRERVGNNDDQKKIGEAGVVVSASVVVLMGAGMGAIYLMQLTALTWVMSVVEVTTVLLFAYHLVQSYRYHNKDDEYAERNEDALDEAAAIRGIRQAHRAARKVESIKGRHSVEDDYRRQHGAAFDSAYRGNTGESPNTTANTSPKLPQGTMAQSTRQENIEDPTSRQSQ